MINKNPGRSTRRAGQHLISYNSPSRADESRQGDCFGAATSAEFDHDVTGAGW
jgi:hypothetical protein